MYCMISSRMNCKHSDTFLLCRRNFDWVKKKCKSNPKRKKLVAEPISRGADEPEVTKVNHYVSSMLAVSLGMKLADSIRRVCMYTKDQHEHKGFYALFRGIFPIQELCGTMTALALARRDVLGQRMPLWKLLLPSVIVHGMANLRGMKVSPQIVRLIALASKQLLIMPFFLSYCAANL